MKRLSKVNDIKYIWHDIDNQELEKLDYYVLCEDDNTIIANFIMVEKNEEIVNMVYEIKLNSDNKCYYFKQWFMITN